MNEIAIRELGQLIGQYAINQSLLIAELEQLKERYEEVCRELKECKEIITIQSSQKEEAINE